MKKFLQICVEIEEMAGRTYRQLSKSKNLPGALKVVLENMADDEDAHAMQLRFALRFPAGTALVDKQIDRAPLEALLTRVKELHDKTCHQELDVRQALEMGIDLEQDFCDAHIGNSMTFRDENLRKMFAALAQADKIHRQKLLDAKEKFL